MQSRPDMTDRNASPELIAALELTSREFVVQRRGGGP